MQGGCTRRCGRHGEMWDVIVCTCQDTENAEAIRNELQIRQHKGLIAEGVSFLVVEDPQPNIGSGSATLNALLCVAEYLAAKEGMTVVSEDALSSARILILHNGRTTFPFCPYGHGFMPHPSSLSLDQVEGLGQTEIWTNFDHFLSIFSELCKDTPSGVWVASLDMLLTVSGSCEPLAKECFEDGIVLLTVTCAPEYATLHGVCEITDTGEMSKMIHCGTMEQVKGMLRPDGLSDILTGIVYFNHNVLGVLLSLHTIPPLDACTYAGLDNGAEPLSLSLFFDVLLCLTTDISYEVYVTGGPGPAPTTVKQRACSVLWKTLKGLHMKAVQLPGMEHHYFRPMASEMLTRYQGGTGESRVINSLVPKDINIGQNSLILNCSLKTPISVGSHSFLMGLGEAFSDLQSGGYTSTQVDIPDHVTVQEIQVTLGCGQTKSEHDIVVVYGIHDNLLTSIESPEATFCNNPWSQLFQRTGITEGDIWPPGSPRTLLHARLFVVSHTSLQVGVRESLWLLSDQEDPNILHRWRFCWRISLNDILSHVNTHMEFSKLRGISFELMRQKMIEVLKENKPISFLSFLQQALVEEKQHCILETLDQVAQEVVDPLIVCRVYACIADMLGYMAGDVGIRAGPAANVNWRLAFSLLEEGKLVEATKALALERNNWIHNSDRMLRASRHYERAGQILTRTIVATSKVYIHGVSSPLPGKTVTVYAPARVDLAGGWTDTPPQSYEWGGMVTTLSLTVRDKYPNKVVAEKIPELRLDLVVLGSDGNIVEKLELTELCHLANYSQPHAPGAMLKAVFICAGIVEFPSKVTLATQLANKYGCGFRIQSMSSLPQGSGLGTSSILGGAVLAALWRVSGEEHSKDSLIHAVLYLEQLLTTGGGWQDQCGGLYGGAKISESGKGLPVHIITRQIPMTSSIVELLNQHLILVYTGKTRLARNLLQDVLRNWHSRKDSVVRNMQDLVDNAKEAASALEKGDLKGLGACLNDYQNQKLVMAPGSLPKAVAVFVASIRDHTYGCCFAGAGGGGFMTLLTKGSSSKQEIQDVIQSNKLLKDFVVYDVKVEDKGLHYIIT